MPSEKDRFDGDNCFVCVHRSGRRFYLYKSQPEDLHLEDIANAISKQVRWMGHLKGDCWYSVAEHCVLVSRMVRILGGSVEEQYAALMHDASEAYLSDIAAPFKRELGGYYDKEKLITELIQKRWHIADSMPTIVRNADWMQLWIEARDLLVDDMTVCQEWIGWAEFGPKAMQLYEEHPEIRAHQWTPREARQKFLAMHEHLANRRVP